MASAGGSGGADTAGACMRPSASRHGRPNGGTVGRQGWSGWLWGAEGDVASWLRLAKGQNGCGARRGGSVHARAKRALWARPEHARQAFGKMPGHARRLGWGWGLTRLG